MDDRTTHACGHESRDLGAQAVVSAATRGRKVMQRLGTAITRRVGPRLKSLLTGLRSQGARSIASSVELGRRAAASGDWHEAVRHWGEVLRHPGPRTPGSAYAQLARAYRKLKRYSEAEVTACQGLERYPNNPRCLIERAETASAAGSWQRALERWEEVLQRLGPGAPGFVYAHLARAHRELGNPEEAERLAVQGLAKYPDSVPCSREHAELATRKGDWASAAHRWRELLQRFGASAPRNARARLAQAESHLEALAAHTRPAHVGRGEPHPADGIAGKELLECPTGLPWLKGPEGTIAAASEWKAAVQHYRALLSSSGPISAHARSADSVRELRDSRGATAASEAPPESPESRAHLTHRAEAAMAKKDWQVAAQLWQKLVARSGRTPEMVYAKWARAYRGLGDLDRAETVAQQGLDSHPGSVLCLHELAEIATARPDWSLAARRWEGRLKAGTTGAPERVYARLGQAYRQLHEFDTAEAIVARGLKEYPKSPSCLREYAEIATAVGDQTAGIRRWEAVLDHHLSRSPEVVRARIYYCGRRPRAAGLVPFSVFARGMSGFLPTCSVTLCGKVHEAYRALEARDANNAVLRFREALQDTEATFPREVWCASFEKVARFYCGDPVEVPPAVGEASGTSLTPSRTVKLCVAGIGWSGSGAAYDYFSEFHQVTSPKLGELHYIEGRNALGRIPATSGDAFKKYLFGLFTDTLLGLVNLHHIRSAWDVAQAGKASRIAFGPTAREIAEAVHRLISRVIVAQAQDAPDYDGPAAEFLDRVLLAQTGVRNGYILLDNWIHCHNADMIKVLDNAYLFAVFRDPRSQYVSAMYEGAKGLVPDAERFAESYRRKMNGFQQSLSRLNDPSRVHVVQFERFVLDQTYREGLARDLGLELDARNEHSRFRPWESAKNMFIHETYPDQSLIHQIERELPEYCVELGSARWARAGILASPDRAAEVVPGLSTDPGREEVRKG